MSKAADSAHLILWRHAEAEEGSPDSARQLTRRGRKQAAGMARWLAARLPENYRLMASPAVRAQQTARALTVEVLTSPRLAVDASAQQILEFVEWPECGGTTVLVGHQPSLGELAALLLTGGDQSWSIRKGAVWWLQQRRKESVVAIRAVIDPELID